MPPHNGNGSGSRDVSIVAPTAYGFGSIPRPSEPATPAEMLKVAEQEIGRLSLQLKEAQMAASTITVAACALMRLHTDSNSAIVPREIWRKMMKAQIGLSQTSDGDVTLSLTERSPEFLHLL